jgi:outer membrane immunogenic protein
LALLATSAMSLVASQPASAADLPPPRPAPVLKAPAVVPPPVYNWTGFYIGVHGGGAWSPKKWGDTSSTCVDVGDYDVVACSDDQGKHDAKGGLAGGQVGFNLQTGNFVFGIEGQWSWSSLKGSHSNSASDVVQCTGQCVGGSDGLSVLTGLSTRVRDVGTVAARLGIVVGASGGGLLFVKGGAAFADDKFSATLTGTCDPVPQLNGYCARINPDFTASWSGTQFRWGWMVGVGGEVKLTQNVSIKAEYNFLDLGKKNVTLTGTTCTTFGTDPTTCSPTSRTFSIDQNIHLVKVGINYLFSTR